MCRGFTVANILAIIIIRLLDGKAMQQNDSSEDPVDKDITLHCECLRVLSQQQRPDAIMILAMIAHEQREFEAAAERYQQFLEMVPEHVQTHLRLGEVLEELGQTERAIEHYKMSLTHEPGNVAAHRHLADACSKIKRWDEAIKAYHQVLVVQHDDVGAMIKLGIALTGAKLIPDSIIMYERALAVVPENALVHRHLGASLHEMGQTHRAIECFVEALRLRPDYFSACLDLAEALRALGKAEEALVPLEKAVSLRPDDEKGHINLALTHKQLGQTEIALTRFEQMLAARPTCGRAYHHMSRIRPNPGLVAVIEELVGNPELPHGDAVNCYFALGNILESAKKFDRAFEYFQKGNRLQRESFSYDPEKITRYVDSLTKVYSRGFHERKRQFGSASQVPVFIVGMPRSGTTLVEQIVSSHDQVHGAGEIRTCSGLTYSILQRLEYKSPDPECMSLLDGQMIREHAARYLRELRLHSPTAARITDKEPVNFFRIGLIKNLFPDARIIHCKRNPLDNCISVFFHDFGEFQCSFELSELGQFYRDYERLMKHWQERFPGEIHTVQYEELVADQEKVSRQLIEYLGLDWDEKCLDFYNNDRNVMTPSNTQVRQPIYTDSIDRWKRYEKNLRPLIDAMQQLE